MKKFLTAITAVFAVTLMLAFHIPAKAAAADTLELKSKAAYVADYRSGEVIYSKNEDERLPIASMTKIMLLNMCFDKLDEGEFTLNDDITVSKTASGMGGSQVFLESDKRYKASELLKSIIVASANDASVAMAERLYGSESACVDEMNSKAKEWGLNNTLFSNCTGLPKPTQYSSAKDVSVMLSRLIAHKEYFNYSKIWTDEIDHGDRKTEITNTNKLVRFYEGCDGGKTGYTAESGFCLAGTAQRGNMRLIAVVIKGENSKSRFADVSSAFNYGFEHYTCKSALDSSKELAITVKVEKGVKKNVTMRPETDIYVFAEKNKKGDVSIDFNPAEKIKAPIKAGDKVGELIVYRDGVEIGRTNAISAENISRKTYFDYIRDVASNWTF